MLPETYDTDGYNPEAPSITNTSRPMYRHRVHAQRPNLIGLTSGDMDLPPRGMLSKLYFSLASYIRFLTLMEIEAVFIECYTGKHHAFKKFSRIKRGLIE